MTEAAERSRQLRRLLKNQEALDLIEEALRSDPESAELLTEKAVILETGLKDYNAALEAYRTILDKEPLRLSALSAAGMLSYMLGDDQNTEIYLKKLTELCPDFSAPAWRILGNLSSRRKDEKLARAYYEKALSLNPALHRAVLSLAAIHTNESDFRTALHLLDTLPSQEDSWNKNPFYAEWLFVKGRTLRSAGRHSEAREFIDRYNELRKDARGLKEKAFIDADDGKTEEALLSLAEAASLLKGVTDPEMQRKTAQLLYSAGKYRESLDYWEALLSEDPANPESLMHKADILSRMKDAAAASEIYEELLRRYPDDQHILFSYAVSLDRTSQFSKSYDIYNKIVKSDPDFGGAWNNLGYACYRLQRYEEAADHYTKSIECREDFAGAWYNRACVHALSGKTEESLSDLSEAVRLRERYRTTARTDPDFDPIRSLPDFLMIVKEA